MRNQLFVALTMLACTAATLEAIPTVRVNGIDTIIDEDFTDEISGLPGVLGHFTGTITSGPFTLHAILGASDSVMDSSLSAGLYLAADIESSAGGSLTLAFSDNDLSAISPAYLLNLGGSIAGGADVTVSFFQGLNNQLFSQDVALGSFTIDNADDFQDLALSGEDFGLGMADDAFSLTIVLQLTHADAGISSFSIASVENVSVPDGGATAGLMGLGLLGMAAFARRRS